MPSYMLDTDALIRLRQRRSPAMTARLTALAPGDAVMSVVTYGELRNGAEKSPDRETRLATLEAMRAIVAVEELTAEIGATYGEIRSDLERRGATIGSNDLWIAAHARKLSLTLVTGNEREFSRVPGLKVENWAGAA